MIYLASALILLWLLATLYVTTLVARQRRLERDMALLKEQLQERRR